MESSLIEHNINTLMLDFDNKNIGNSDDDTEQQASDLLSWLNQFISKHDSVTIIPSSDLFALLLSSIATELDERYKFLIPNDSVIRQCIDKFKFFSFCHELEIDAPDTHIVEHLSDCESLNLNFFPCIVKPYNNRVIPNDIITKVRSVEDKPELLELASKILQYDNKFIIQKLIRGNSNDRFFVGGLVANTQDDNKLFVGKKLREVPSLGGSTTHCVLEWNDPVFDTFLSFVKKTNYVGLIDFEMMFDSDEGLYKIIEINPRIGAWHLVSKQNSCNIIYYYYSMLNNINIDDYSPHIEGKLFLKPHTHFCSLLEEYSLPSTLVKISKDFFNANIIAGISIKNYAITFKSIRVILGCIKRHLFNQPH